jgi:chromosome segregation ATPase
MAQQAPSREREALRRAQAALQQSQQERDALAAEKATLQRQAQDADKRTQALQARLAAAMRELQLEREAVAAARAETLALRGEVERERASAEERVQAAERRHRQELAALQGQIGERTRTNQALVAQLEVTASALREAEARNLRLHQLGEQALALYRGLTPGERLRQADRLFGLTAVQIESQAEELLARLDAERLPARP